MHVSALRAFLREVESVLCRLSPMTVHKYLVPREKTFNEKTLKLSIGKDSNSDLVLQDPVTNSSSRCCHMLPLPQLDEGLATAIDAQCWFGVFIIHTPTSLRCSYTVCLC